MATNFQFVEPLRVIPASARHDAVHRPRVRRVFHRQAGSLSHGPSVERVFQPVHRPNVPRPRQRHDGDQRPCPPTRHRPSPQSAQINHGRWVRHTAPIGQIPQRGYFPQPGVAAPAATPGQVPIISLLSSQDCFVRRETNMRIPPCFCKTKRKQPFQGTGLVWGPRTLGSR